MNALAMPISSRIAADMDWACFCAKSPRIFDERSATSWHTLASSCVSFWLAGCIPHDAIRAGGAACLAGVVKIMQVGYRLAHGEERLVRIKRPAKEYRQQLARAALAFAELLLQLGKPVAMVALQLCDALVRAAKGFAVRWQDQHVGRQLARARHRIQKQA